MTTNKVLKEVWVENDKSFFIDFSPIGKYSFLFERYIFRGERSNKFKKLLPSALREDESSIKKLYGFSALSGMDKAHTQHNFETFYQAAELNVLLNFYKAANYKGLNLPSSDFFRKRSLEIFPTVNGCRAEIGEKWLPDSFLELAALAQHYGLPTRLIDWSKDIYTSLYFATSGALHSDDDTEYILLYALDYLTIEWLKNSTMRIPLRLIVPEHCKNPNLNHQKGILVHGSMQRYICLTI